jgi:Synergist-CTERM protein sorting domain-containing protein
LSRSWNGLIVTASSSGKITIDKDPSAAASAQAQDVTALAIGTFTVTGTVTVSGGTPTPVTQTFDISYTPTTTPTGPAFNTIGTIRLTTAEDTTETIDITSTAGTVTLSSVTPPSWNGLTLSTSGNTITIKGAPTIAGSQAFTVLGSVGSTPSVTGQFTIIVTDGGSQPTPPAPTPGSADEIGAPSTWRKERSGYHYMLTIPITKEFITRFDTNKDGTLSSTELADVTPGVTAPNANLVTWDWSVTESPMYLDLEFEPKDGHSKDWYSGVRLETLTFTDPSGNGVRYTFTGGVELEKVANLRKGGGGGCDAGLSLLALALLAPLALRGKKR